MNETPGVDPAKVMHTIRDGVKGGYQAASAQTLAASMDASATASPELHGLVVRLEQSLNRLAQVAPPRSLARMAEPELGSRFQALGNMIVWLRKVGTRLFTRWYVRPMVQRQEYFNEAMVEVSLAAYQALSEVAQIQSQLVRLSARAELAQVESRLQQVEARITSIEADSMLPAFDYSRFNQRFGASPEAEKAIYAQYVPHFQNCSRVADLGCGKGPFLELLRDAGVGAYGVDSDPELIRMCHERGLEAQVGGVMEHLEALKPGSVDGLFLGHIIEHLPHYLKLDLARLCYEKVAPGGVVIVETPNTRSQHVMSHVYFLDPTHKAPLHPETYRFIFEQAGLNVDLAHLTAPIHEDPPEGSTEYYNLTLILRRPGGTVTDAPGDSDSLV